MSTPTTAEAAVKALFTAAAEEDAAYGQLLGRLCTLRSTQESEGGWERDVQLGEQLSAQRPLTTWSAPVATAAMMPSRSGGESDGAVHLHPTRRLVAGRRTDPAGSALVRSRRGALRVDGEPASGDAVEVRAPAGARVCDAGSYCSKRDRRRA